MWKHIMCSMNRQAFLKKRLPDTPGVYFFLGDADRRGHTRGFTRRKILYIGRATSLRDRVRSYFRGDLLESRGPWIQKMLGEVRGIDYRKTDSVLEAILLEADLIKKFKPPYNTDLKDDKSFNCVVITKENFPRILVVRQRDADFTRTSRRPSQKSIEGVQAIYGPFPGGFELKQAMKIIRRIFPYRDGKCVPCSLPRMSAFSLRPSAGYKPCFNRQIGLCPGVCTGEISKQEYAKTVRNIRLFFEGKKARLLKLLEREMNAAAKQMEFERAGELKRQIFALKHIQDVALLKTFNFELLTFNLRIEGYDLSHFGGKEIVGAMAVVEEGVARPSEYRLFRLRGIQRAHEVAGLQEILRRRLNHPEWPFPGLIVVDGNEVQKRAAEAVLTGAEFSIPVVAVVKDKQHHPREILGLDEERQGRTLGRKKGPTLAGSYPRLSASSLHRSALLANSEAHRFVLRFQKKQRFF